MCVCPQPFSRHIPMPDWLQENLKSSNHSRILDHLVTNVWIGTADDYFHLLYTYMILYEMYVYVCITINPQEVDLPLPPCTTMTTRTFSVK